MPTRALAAAATLALTVASVAVAALPDAAYELRNLGLAQLENERPGEAEATYRRLVEVAPNDPLGHANLAIALLRQQQFDEALQAIDAALRLAPRRADLLATRGEILVWKGDREEALALLIEAASSDPDNLDVLYRLHRHASSMRGPEAEAATARAVERLAELRPENLYVLLRVGQGALARGDRAQASSAYLRIRELLWQAQPIAQTALESVLEALEKGDLEAARVPSLRMENVLKITPMFRGGLLELSIGIQGVPIERFTEEPPRATFGPPVPIELRASTIDEAPGAPQGLVLADLDGDERIDVARLTGTEPSKLEIRLASDDLAVTQSLPAPPVRTLAAIDLDNDGALDLLGAGPGLVLWRGDGKGGFSDATATFALGGLAASRAVAFDYDAEGDLDLAIAGDDGKLDLLRNALEGPLDPVGDRALPGRGATTAGAIAALAASDLDRDGDPDLIALGRDGILVLDNLRQGRFADRTRERGLAGAQTGAAMTVADLDNDGWPDLVVAAGAERAGGAARSSAAEPPSALAIWRNRDGRFERWQVTGDLPGARAFDAVIALDADNDGRLDLAAAGEDGVLVLTQPAPGVFLRASVDREVRGGGALAAADLDGDGDVELVASGRSGLHRLDNAGGNRNGWLAVRLRGLTQGNDKNNVFGVGATVEVKAGDAYQFREADGGVVHFGLGDVEEPDLVRVTWTNGVPQNRIRPKRDQLFVEEQVLKGSCPFLYTETGSGIEFVTDLLWGAPLGMPVAEGAWAGWDLAELVRVDGAAAVDGAWDLRVTEELWEAAYFDLAKLWVVDHPADVEVASSLRVVPGVTIEERILGAAEVRPVARALDGRGRDVTDRVARRDEVYADGYRVARFQGVAAEPWTFTLDLGEAPAAPVRLLLDGWLFPADASLNLAIDQRRRALGRRGEAGKENVRGGDADPSGFALASARDAAQMSATRDGEPDRRGESDASAGALVETRLEMETSAGWRVLLPRMGDPAGKTKTMAIDTPPLPPGVRRLRIVTSKWLHWDRVAWTTAARDDVPRIVAKLAPTAAELRWRGFSRLVRRAPNAPHHFDYASVSIESPWLPFPGRYTRYGDVRELLLDPDDRQVILAPGDELALRFDGSALEPTPAGWRRTVFLESHGWDKDADRNTWEANQMEPLPFRAMKSYPYAEGESYPDTPELRRYREEWLTREVPGPADAAASR